MKIIKPSVEFLGAVPTDYEGAVKFIEMAGRTCYKSESKISADSAEKFVKKLISARPSPHLAMVEHSNFVVYLTGNSTANIPYLEGSTGKYLNYFKKHIGGNLTAWYYRFMSARSKKSIPLYFYPFYEKYKQLFNLPDTDIPSNQWVAYSSMHIPDRLQRYSVKFICDRGVSHELVRHRPCSFAQESTRYVNYSSKDMEFIEPAGFVNWSWAAKNIFKVDCKSSELLYKAATFVGLSPQQARAVLPNALKTEVIVTADLEEWVHIFKLRCHKSAHPDFVRLAVQLRDKFIEEELIQQ